MRMSLQTRPGIRFDEAVSRCATRSFFTFREQTSTSDPLTLNMLFVTLTGLPSDAFKAECSFLDCRLSVCIQVLTRTDAAVHNELH